MIKLTSEEIKALPDGVMLKVVQVNPERHVASLYTKNGYVLELSNIDDAMYNRSPDHYVVDEIDGENIVAFRSGIPIADLMRCREVYTSKEHISYPIYKANKELITERLKHSLLQRCTVNMLEAGYLTDGYSIRFDWDDSETGIMSITHKEEVQNFLTFAMSLKAYVIKDIEPKEEMRINFQFPYFR